MACWFLTIQKARFQSFRIQLLINLPWICRRHYQLNFPGRNICKFIESFLWSIHIYNSWAMLTTMDWWWTGVMDRHQAITRIAETQSHVYTIVIKPEWVNLMTYFAVNAMWILLTNGQWCWKRFHDMASSSAVKDCVMTSFALILNTTRMSLPMSRHLHTGRCQLFTC